MITLAKDKLEDYRLLAEKAGNVFKEHGALDYLECVGDDFDAKDFLPFPQIANAGPDETVIFSGIAYESREHRDEVNAKVNAKVKADPRMKEMCGDSNSPPFDPTLECRRASSKLLPQRSR